MRNSESPGTSPSPRCTVRLLVFSASLRQGSINARLAELAATVSQSMGAIVTRQAMVDFDCPSYDQDVELAEGVPPGARRLSDALSSSDAFVIASPEYNASLPGVLKNTIDWVSRIKPQPFNGRQGLLMSASPSMAGGNRGLWALRVPLEHLGARIYPDMFSLATAHQAFDASGRIASEALQQRFDRTLECFLDLVEAARNYPALKKQWIEFLGEKPDAGDRVEEVSLNG